MEMFSWIDKCVKFTCAIDSVKKVKSMEMFLSGR